MENISQNYIILQSAIVGFEFEFYSNYDVNETAKKLSKYINKKIIVQSEKSHTEHSNINDYKIPYSGVFVLSVDYSGGKNMLELMTCPMEYKDARITMIKVNEWIKNNGWTTNRASIHMNISFDENKIKLNDKLKNLNILKIILSIDENYIYKYFPTRRNSVYARSVKSLYPIVNNINLDDTQNINTNNVIFPKNKYFGVNFSKLNQGYLEFRYTGDKNYERKTQALLNLLDYYILLIYNCIQNNNTYTQSEKSRFSQMIKKYKNILNNLSSYETFAILYPNIILTIDLKQDENIIKFYWNYIQDVLTKLILYFNFNEGYFNYDTDISKCQVYKSKLESDREISNVEFFNCELMGEFEYCVFFNCFIYNSMIYNSNFKINNKIINSKIMNSILNYSNTVDNSFINNKNTIVDCKVNGGVIRNGVIGKNSEISKNTRFVQYTRNFKDNKKDNLI